ncbi:ribbon-helix-helix protein, CopG family [Nitratifractor sp.]
MTTTVRFDEKRAEILEKMTILLHKKKSEVIREALDYYAEHILRSRERRIAEAVKKVAESDAKELKIWDDTVDDGL